MVRRVLVALLVLLAAPTVFAQSADVSAATILSQGEVPTPFVDLDVTLTTDPQTAVNVGDIIAFTVGVNNFGTGAAPGVSVQQTLPAGLVLVSAPPWCTGSETVTCATPLLGSSMGATFTLLVRAVQPGTMTMTSTAATTATEQNTANNSATTTIVVKGPPPPSRRRAARH